MRALRCAIFTTVLSWGALSGHSVAKSSVGLTYATDNLQAIGTVTGLDSIAPDSLAADTVFFFDLGGCPARADIRRGQVRHIGYRLFPDTVRTTSTLPVFDFLERFALEQDLPVEQPNAIEREKIVFKGIKPASLPSLYGRQLPFSVSTEEFKTYHVVWTPDSGEAIEAVVPILFNLLNGTELPENERRLLEDLTGAGGIDSMEIAKVYTVDKDNLEATKKLNCYVLRGGRFFTEYLNADRYYENNPDSLSSAFRILDNEAYPVESISNMLTGLDIPNDIEVQLKMIAYPMDKKVFTLPLRQLVAYFLSQGCEIYTGLTKLDDKSDKPRADYVIIGRNDRRGYCHSVKMSVPLDVLKEKTGTATGKITPYIPLPKILNMFAE